MKSNKWKIKAILLDLDGTLIDSNALHNAAFQTIIKSYAQEGNISFEYNKFKGMKTSKVFEVLGFDSKKLVYLLKKKQELYRTFIKNNKVKIFPFVLELLEYLKKEKYDQYIVSGSSYKNVKAIVKHTNIGKYIKDFVSGDEVMKGKPSPDIYIKALKTFGLTCNEAIAIEDSKLGILSSINAKIKTISVDYKYEHPLVTYMNIHEIGSFIKKNQNQDYSEEIQNPLSYLALQTAQDH